MAHGGYMRSRVSGRNSSSSTGRSKGTSGGVGKKPKNVSLKNQIRSVERMLRKELPHEVREAQEKKLEGLKKQLEIQNCLAVERKIFLRNRKIKFFERRKIERRIRRLEKMQRSSVCAAQQSEIAEQLPQLKEDLEYIKFFPKSEKYVPLYAGGEHIEIVDRRNKLRKQIKANISAAAASGKELEETGSEDDGLLDLSDDDFFAGGSSSDEVDADDELTDKSTRELASSTSGKGNSSISGDSRNQKQISARALMPPPLASTTNILPSSVGENSRTGSSSRKKQFVQRSNVSTSSSNTSNTRSTSFSGNKGFSNSQTGHSSNLSSNSDARKPRRKRRPKKKKQQV